MASLNQLKNPNPNSGDTLRDLASDYLSTRFGTVQIEKRVAGKKVDAFFEHNHFGQTTRYYLESKDYEDRLSRSQVVHIWADYSGIIRENAPAKLLLVTRNGLSTDAESFIKEQPDMLHQTIWEVENQALDLMEYQIQLRDEFKLDSLSEYYIDVAAKPASYDSTDNKRTLSTQGIDLFNEVVDWMENSSPKPIAILGGYGAGKTSFAKKLASHYSERAVKNPSERRVISIKLGGLTSAANLPNLLGGMFTNIHPIQNFNYDRFIKFNANGRFLIILDGFDEMKHAMPWNDFKYIIKELNKLVVPRSKVILLGRPTALLTEYEHWHVLRGLKKVDAMTNRLPGWPEYSEYDLLEFTQSQRHDFIRNYMNVALQDLSIGEETNKAPMTTKDRVTEICNISDQETEVFSKPVHLRILVEVSANMNTNLSDLQQDFSRWKLYRLFMDSLVEREMEKEARKDLTKKERLGFLRELATWLWVKKNATTNFSFSELPFDYPEDEMREYLIGSILEKKSTDYYYFAHRSFPEYFLADLILETSGEARCHERNSAILTDGVELFLSDGANNSFYETAIRSLSNAKGKITISYLNFILSYQYEAGKKVDLLSKKSIWRPLITLIEREHKSENKTLESANEILYSESSPEQWAMALLGLLHLKPKHPTSTRDFHTRSIENILAFLLQKIFMAEFDGATDRNFTVNESDVGFHVNALKRSTEFGTTQHHDKVFVIDCLKLDQFLKNLLLNEGITIDFGSDDYFSNVIGKKYQVQLDSIANQCGDMKVVILKHFQYNRNLSGITLKKTKKKIQILSPNMS